MLKPLSSFLLLTASALAGCATTYNTPTYSGDVKAAIADDVAVVKAAGAKAGEYVRSSLTSPMPEWKHEGAETNSNQSSNIVEKSSSSAGRSAKTTSELTSKSTDDSSAGVQVFAVEPGNTTAEPSSTGSTDRP